MNALREEAIIIADISDRPNFPSIKRKMWDINVHKGVEQGTQTPIIEVIFVVEHWVDNNWTENDCQITLICRKGEILTDGNGDDTEPYSDILTLLKTNAPMNAIFTQWVAIRDADGTIDSKLIASGIYKLIQLSTNISQ